jgi:hypothetical protein
LETGLIGTNVKKTAIQRCSLDMCVCGLGTAVVILKIFLTKKIDYQIAVLTQHTVSLIKTTYHNIVFFRYTPNMYSIYFRRKLAK